MNATCEELELLIHEEELSEVSVDEAGKLYCVHLLSYLLKNDLNNARFLWKRIPVQFRTSEEQI